jgi:hypothetical protein
VRKRIHAGTLHAQPFGRSFMVWLPDDAETVGAPGPEPGPASGPERGPEPIEAAYQVTPAEIERAVERTGQKYVTDIAALYDRVSEELSAVYEGQLAAKDQVIAAKDETIDELRRRAEVAEAELLRRREADADAGALYQRRVDQERHNQARMEEPLEEPPLSAWARLGRWWRGTSE